MTEHDPLLLDTLRNLRDAVERVQDGMDQMRDRLDVVANSMDRRLSDEVKPLSLRITVLEQGQEDFHMEVKRDARKWGAIGGASALLTAAATAVIAFLSKALAGVK